MTEIAISLRSGESTPEGYRFRPGEDVKGSVQITPDKDINCRHFYVRLAWHTEGRGDRDTGTGAEIDLYQGTLGKGLPVYRDFSLVMPDQPWSYAGHYITIVWEVKATIDIPQATDVNAALPIILVPAGR